jgi:hypothetical protein
MSSRFRCVEGHHREVHRCGDEAAWWKKAGIDPTVAARAPWLKTHPLPNATAIGEDLGVTSDDNGGPTRLPTKAATTPIRRPNVHVNRRLIATISTH